MRIDRRTKQLSKDALMEQLFETYYTRLYLYALSFLTDEEEAKDVVSETFSDLWQQWQQEDSPQLPNSTFLYVSVRNRCIDFMRHARAKENFARFVEESYRLAPDDAEEYEQYIRQLRTLITNLPEPEKSILHCCYFKRMSYQETAEALLLTTVIVKKRMLKVFKILREGLKIEKK